MALIGALKETVRSIARMPTMAWLLLLLLHLTDVGTHQYFTYASDFIRSRGREDLLLIATTAGLEVLFNLIWTAFWLITVVGAIGMTVEVEAGADVESNPVAVALKTRIARSACHLNPLLIEQIRALASVFWRLPLFIVPAIVRYVRLSLVPFVVLCDPRYAQGNIDALKNSRGLSRGHFFLLALALSANAIAPEVVRRLTQGDQGELLWLNPWGVGLGAALTFPLNVVTTVFMCGLYRQFSPLISPQPLAPPAS